MHVPYLVREDNKCFLKNLTFQTGRTDYSPNRHLDFSPFNQHRKTKAADIKIRPTANRTVSLTGLKVILHAVTQAIYITKTTQPCQQLGNVHPNPYFLAGNQIFFSSAYFILISPQAERLSCRTRVSAFGRGFGWHGFEPWFQPHQAISV